MVRGGTCLFAAVIAAAPVASAETMSFGDAAAMLAASCAADIEANCRGVNLDAGRLRECLSRNRDALSPQCRTDFLKSFDAIQKRVAARATVANACRREIVKLCAGSTAKASKSIPCLTSSSTQGVSAQCKGAMSDAGYR
jgi:Zn-finger nucleic acid-binding protein